MVMDVPKDLSWEKMGQMIDQTIYDYFPALDYSNTDKFNIFAYHHIVKKPEITVKELIEKYFDTQFKIKEIWLYSLMNMKEKDRFINCTPSIETLKKIMEFGVMDFYLAIENGRLIEVKCIPRFQVQCERNQEVFFDILEKLGFEVDYLRVKQMFFSSFNLFDESIVKKIESWAKENIQTSIKKLDDSIEFLKEKAIEQICTKA